MKMKKNLLFMLALLVSVSMVFVSCINNDEETNPDEYMYGTYVGKAKITTGEESTEENMSAKLTYVGAGYCKLTITGEETEDSFSQILAKDGGIIGYNWRTVEGRRIEIRVEGSVADKKMKIRISYRPALGDKTTLTFEGTKS